MRILFLVPYPLKTAPSQRFRFEQYFEILSKNNIEFVSSSFLSEEVWSILYKKGFILKKSFGIISGFIKRFLLLFEMGSYDFIFIHRETAPIGPPVLEWMLAKVLRKKIIYDFDDAIWIPNSSENNRFFGFFKRSENVRYLCKIAYKVSCGNHYLCDFAKQFNKNVIYNPTTIDIEGLHNKVKNHEEEKFVIGWTGSHSTMQYLDELFPTLRELEKKYEFETIIISDQEPKTQLKSLRFVRWNKQTEIEDILKFNIGLMPLSDDKWAKGKCGFKALQYMALGIPALVSPVGVNSSLVDHYINGFICTTEKDWKDRISQLIEDRDLLKRMGSKTRERVVSEYSVLSNSSNFLHLFA